MSGVFASRREILRSFLVEQKIASAMILDPANVFYYTGFRSDPHERFMALLMDVEKEENYLFVPALDREAALSEADIEKIISISDEQLPFEVVKHTISSELTIVGIEAKAISYYRYINLLDCFPNASVLDIQPFINEQRKKKTKDEVDKLKAAINIIERVLGEGIKKVKVGMTEAELTAEMEFLMRKFGADGPSFSTIILSGERAALPHGSPGERRIQKGDFLLVDFGVIKDGYCSDITRTFIVGEPTAEQREIYNIVLQSNNAGIQAVKAGVPLKTIDFAARDVIVNQGYGEYFNNRVGHGLGIELHEDPSIHANNEQLTENGLVFTIEPGIYIPGVSGVRIEDIVYIDEQGEVEVLTAFPKELQIL